MIFQESILDNDLYKFSMGNVVSRMFPQLNVRYEFINRGGHEFPPGFADRLEEDLTGFERLSLSLYEKAFLLNKCPYLDRVYLDFLEGYRYDPSEVTISQSGKDLTVSIEGPWYRTIYWEVPLMAMISEEYYLSQGFEPNWLKTEVEAKKKAARIKEMGVTVSDFGTRRRFSRDIHKIVVSTMKNTLVGTSNVYLAMVNNLKPIGTMAHELFMALAAVYGYRMANRMALDAWVEIFRGNLGIALSDTYTTEVFLKAFDSKLAKLFDGVRQDSGDPITQAKKIISHYEKLGIDPLTKTIVFSDSLNLDKVQTIHDFCKGKIKDVYGIGTNLTNDIGAKPMNMVIKLSGVQDVDGFTWIPAVKLSDDAGKNTGHCESVQLCKNILRVS